MHAHAVSPDVGRYQQRFGGVECAIGIGNGGRYDEAIWLQKRDELGLPPSVITLPRILKDAGYDTALIGKWHLGYLPKFPPTDMASTSFLEYWVAVRTTSPTRKSRT
jgi:N-acetylgalactosamine-6-sulfatase